GGRPYAKTLFGVSTKFCFMVHQTLLGVPTKIRLVSAPSSGSWRQEKSQPQDTGPLLHLLDKPSRPV
ncbi:hypothetical protein VU08_06425, partial [Desulfobulbus sp. F5]|nr:hypothetical protein [Desulfobulbus sp. F5]